MHGISELGHERLVELPPTCIPDTGPSEELDALVAHVRDLLGVPVCLVTHLTDEHQIFKAQCGLDISRTSREIAFCNYTILGNDVLVVEDATMDSRFSSNPLVSGVPHVRFYAGAPLLIRPGVPLGSLCVIDTRPRVLTEIEISALRQLAKIATGLIEAHALAVKAVQYALEAKQHRRVVEAQERELTLRERRFQQTEALARIGGWEFDCLSGRVVMSNECYRIYGLPFGIPMDKVRAVSIYHGKEGDRLNEHLDRCLDSGIAFDDEFEIISTSGERKWVRVLGEAEFVEGAPRRLFGTIQDISARHSEAVRLWEAANRDALTGLANRHRFNQVMDGLFATADARPGLLMVDADHLKDVNDTLGHEAGDELIRTIGSRLAEQVGSSATVARIGGDEFAVLFPRADEALLTRSATTILEAMSAAITSFDRIIKPQISIGGAIGSVKDGAEALRQDADLALYRAKQTHRGDYVTFKPEMRRTAQARACAIGTVDAALSEERVIPWYQPIVRIADGCVTGLEALARVRDTDGQILSIGNFPEALEDHRTATRLTERMLNRIASEVTVWRGKGLVVPRLAVNVGTADFRRLDIRRLLAEFGEKTGLDPSYMSIEVTESVFLGRNTEDITRTLRRLREDGVAIVLDDFGTGFAALSHLASFPVDVIKIDRSFTMRMTQAGAEAAITSTLVELAQKLGIEVVAEGVETEEQLELLRQWGCHKVQGYLFSRPLPALDVAHLMRSVGLDARLSDADGSRRVASLIRSATS